MLVNPMIPEKKLVDSPAIRYVVFRYAHHSPHSGYSRLAEYGINEYPASIIKISEPLPKWLIRDKIYWYLAKGTPGYNRKSMRAELIVARRILQEKGSIFHFLYGETTYHYTGSLNNHNNNRIVATFHLPPVGIKKSWLIEKPLQQLSAVVCVGTSQMDYLGKIVGYDKVFFAPLGLDLEYYTPPIDFDSRDPDLCLMVGENYRDFPALRGVIELVTYLRPKTHFVLVLRPESFELIGQHPNVTILSNVPEDDLRELYRKASLLVMPLKDATANNALLEAMGCGLQIVVKDVGSTRDYVNESCAALLPINDAKKMAECVVDLLDARRDLEKMSEAAVVQAGHFSWPKVVRQLRKVYTYVS